jgi:pimeloyl-ACP methyl ester carboxylesterase
VWTFALIHGAWHGGWCFEHVEALLEGEGARVVAADLPCEDTDAGAEEYARIVSDAIGAADDLVVVGHSLGGLTAPLLAEARPVRHLVFVCGLLPQPGLSLRDQLEREPSMLGPAEGETVRDEQDRSYWGDEQAAVDALYQDCHPEVARGAAKRLRPQARMPAAEPTPLARWPEVPSTYLVCRDDRITNPDWARRAARDRLGVEPIELPGGHTPMLSRPGHVAEILLGIAHGVPGRG